MEPTQLIVVAGHAAFKAKIDQVPSDYTRDDAWVLQSFQKGEPVSYVAHLRRGVELARENPMSLVIFSGGRSRLEAGLWSEARTYRAIAEAEGWWIPEAMGAERTDISSRSTLEEFARDSFENLLFGVCRFREVCGRYPNDVVVVSWAFKRERFDLHRATIRFPVDRFQFVGVGTPQDQGAARRGERAALAAFAECPYGNFGELATKRAARNPFGRQHPYRRSPRLEDFFLFIDAAQSARPYWGTLPWEEPASRQLEAVPDA